MKVVSVINYKGGVGKTTVTANLSAKLALDGYKILLIDLDPQTSLTFSFIKIDYWQEQLAQNKTISKWFDAVIKEEKLPFKNIIFKNAEINSLLEKGKVDLIASHLDLINIDLELAAGLGGSSLTRAKQNYLKTHKRLANGIEEIKELSYYDLILIDCPPNFNVVTKNAIAASDYLLIPAKPDYLSTLGINYLERNLKDFVKDYNEYVKLDNDTKNKCIDPQTIGVVFTMVQFYGNKPINSLRQYIDQIKKQKFFVFNTCIRENKTIFSDAPENAIPVVASNYSSPNHKNIIKEINSFTEEFKSKLKLI